MLQNSIENKILHNLNQIKKDGYYRQLFSLNQNNSDLIDFTSNDALDLRNHPKIIEAGYQAVKQSGAGTGASRLVLETDKNIQFLEHLLAKTLNLNSAVFFPSGFIANVSFFDVMSELDDVEFFIDHRAHASLFFGIRASKVLFQTFRHNDFENLNQKLLHSDKKHKIIVVESLHSTDGDILDGDQLIRTCETHQALVFLDDSHGFGIIGNGLGYLGLYPKLRKYLFSVSIGCGKAIGVSGGFLASSSFLFKEFLIQKSKHLMFSTGISPFITGAVSQSIELIFSEEGQERRKMLFHNIDIFTKLLTEFYSFNNFKTHIFPIIIGDNQKALTISNSMIYKGYLVKCLRPPSVPKNTSRLRISIKSSHTENSLELLCKTLKTELA